MQSANWLENGAFKVAVDAVAVNGYPLCAVIIALNCHPPANLEGNPFCTQRLPLPNGKSATALAPNVCRMSVVSGPRFNP